jgi:hypothetical protein
MAEMMPNLRRLGGRRGALMPGSAGCFSSLLKRATTCKRGNATNLIRHLGKSSERISALSEGKKKHSSSTPKKVPNGLREERVESARLTGEGMVGGNLWF